ncbi:MAG: DUF1214 domain-containing protein [Pseudoruegeria sp.]
MKVGTSSPVRKLFTAAFLTLVTINAASKADAEDMPSEPRGGQPPAGSQPSKSNFADQVMYQRAFEAVVWSQPAVMKYGLRRATMEIGGGDNVILAWSSTALPLFETLTPNNTTPYVTATTDLRNGPVVLEVPKATDKASLFGQVADNWFITIADIGPIGVDKGEGAKILLTPPGYAEDVPSGYIEVKSTSFILDFAFRSVPSPDGTLEDAYAMSKSLKMYYLSELPNPEPTKIIDPLKMRWSTLPRYDERYFEDLQMVIDAGPTRERDKAMMGMLKSIGIEKGKPYNPDEKTTKAFRQAAIDAYHYMLEGYVKGVPAEMFWDNRSWRNVFYTDQDGGFSWDTEGMLDYDNRAIRNWFNVIYFPAGVAEVPATMYVDTPLDSDGNIFQAGKTYKLTVPADVPASKFWSLTIYDMATWAFIYTPEGQSGLSSRERDSMQLNDDDSVTIYFGPEAPEGLESNWIPTVDKVPFPMFRFYGPEDALFNGEFVLNEIELVK